MKAHTRFFGNEIADRLAKEAAQNYYVTYRRIPKSSYKEKIPGKKAEENGDVNGRKQRKGRLLKNFIQVWKEDWQGI